MRTSNIQHRTPNVQVKKTQRGAEQRLQVAGHVLRLVLPSMEPRPAGVRKRAGRLVCPARSGQIATRATSRVAACKINRPGLYAPAGSPSVPRTRAANPGPSKAVKKRPAPAEQTGSFAKLRAGPARRPRIDPRFGATREDGKHCEWKKSARPHRSRAGRSGQATSPAGPNDVRSSRRPRRAVPRDGTAATES